MSIVKMKRILLAAPLQDKGKLLEALQRLGCVQVTGFELSYDQLAGLARPQEAAKSGAQADQDLVRLRWAITKIGKYDPKKTSMFSPKPAAQMEQLLPGAEAAAARQAVVEETEALERLMGELRGQEARITAQMDLLSPWLPLDISPDAMRDTPSTRQFAGTLPMMALQPLLDAWSGKPVSVEMVSAASDTAYLWAVAHASVAADFAEALKQVGFAAASFTQGQGTFQTQHDALRQDLAAVLSSRKEADARMTGLVRALPDLKVYHDAVAAGRARIGAEDKLINTRESFLLKGWLPEPLEQKVLAMLDRDFPDALTQVSLPEPGDEPPVLLYNNPVISPFESVVTGFAIPSAEGLDPSAVMMPFFACFLGMMVSDAGYGIMMALLVPLLIKVMKPGKAAKKLFWVIGIGGLFTIFWGFIYNTWFGFSPMANPIMDPINRPMEVMILCIALGAVHLLVGLGMAAYLHIRRKEYLDVLYDQLSWLMVLAGIGMLAVPNLAHIGQYLALAGVLIILLFAGRNKTKNPFKRLLSGLGALYGITSWVSDLLSYVRLFGMGLATGVIGLVINQLVGMIFASGPIGWVLGSVIFVGAHTFNAGINILGAYVHSCRLQYIEFFGKFYEEGGKPFKPLEQAPRYVRISDA